VKCDRRWYNDGRVSMEAGLSPFADFPIIQLPVLEYEEPVDAVLFVPGPSYLISIRLPESWDEVTS
jgi:hypothetical protein